MFTSMNFVWDSIGDFAQSSGIAMIINDGSWLNLVMIGVSCLLLYLAIHKQFEPLLLFPIAFGMLLTNLPGAEMFHTDLFEGGHGAGGNEVRCTLCGLYCHRG